MHEARSDSGRRRASHHCPCGAAVCSVCASSPVAGCRRLRLPGCCHRAIRIASHTWAVTEALDGELYWQCLRFENECLKRHGATFQMFFEAVMLKADSSFQVVKPWGSEGDRKCDGMSPATGRLFQVYAPEGITAATTVSKIEEDFEGAKEHWNGFRGWVFVWSAVEVGLPPAVVEKLRTLRADDANAAILIEDWNREALWVIVKTDLTAQQRAELLGPVPVPATTTAAEIRTVLNWLVETGPEPIEPDEGFESTALGKKIELNKLSDQVAKLIGRALPVASEVERYVSGSYDSAFSSKVASRLIALYQRLEVLEDDPDRIFVALVDEVAEGSARTAAEWWGAVGIVSYYFELCDIFKQ